ncbi:hypothetical protein EDC40_11739 [Aminobacter aminovorans]|uniref:Uncharacterized protein n=1 Tax=Aminobacter aminovorans TaxID=83263 RepID=A0A381ILB2_AMIAI|nr:hypothetical protein EDC40_11739 [Aminobacter aminovorans]SUY28288.1 Uncharacterised protein [Aminobacter aminovorans]
MSIATRAEALSTIAHVMPAIQAYRHSGYSISSVAVTSGLRSIKWRASKPDIASKKDIGTALRELSAFQRAFSTKCRTLLSLAGARRT